MAGPEAGTKATIAALVANILIAGAKLLAFVFTRSASMLAESIHSAVDAGNQALLLLGMRRAKREATASHPFGYGRERYFWSFIVAMVLFTLGGIFSIFEGVEKFRHPHEVESMTWAIGVLVVAIVLETFSFRTAIKEANHVRGDQGWWSFIRHSKSPELPVVLLEDLGALVGLIFALTGVSLAAITHDGRYDALGSLAIGVLLCVIAYILAAEMRSLLLGESASAKDIEAIDRALRSQPNVSEIVHVRTQHIGPNELLIGAKVRLDRGLSLGDVSDTINRIELAIRNSVDAESRIYIEPEIQP
jgi:cation diffusion facilitator family transporter